MKKYPCMCVFIYANLNDHMYLSVSVGEILPNEEKWSMVTLSFLLMADIIYQSINQSINKINQ